MLSTSFGLERVTLRRKENGGGQHFQNIYDKIICHAIGRQHFQQQLKKFIAIQSGNISRIFLTICIVIQQVNNISKTIVKYSDLSFFQTEKPHRSVREGSVDVYVKSVEVEVAHVKGNNCVQHISRYFGPAETNCIEIFSSTLLLNLWKIAI